MKSLRIPLVVWSMVLALSLASALVSAHWLPDRVAIHFGWSGRANGWMSRGGNLAFSIVLDVFTAVFEPALMYAIRYLGGPATLNVPHAEIWRTSEHYPQAWNFLLRQSIWFGTGFTAWAACLDLVLVRANQVRPPALPGHAVAWLNVALLVGALAWVARLFVFFLRPPKNENQA